MADMTLRRLADGVEKTGPEGPVPEGFERVDKASPKREFTPSRTALDVILNPQGTIEQAISLPASMALTGGAGALAKGVLPAMKYAPAIARSAAEGIQRGVGSAIQGEGLSDILTKAGMGTVTAGATEGLMGLAGKVGSRLAGTARFKEMQTAAAERSAEFLKRAREMPRDAYDAIKFRLMGGTIAVPSLATGKIRVEDAVEKLRTVNSPLWETAIDEISQGMNMLDKTQFATKAGDMFKAALPPKLFPARAAPKPSLPDTGTARTIADVLTGRPISEGGEGGVPAGSYLIGGALSGGMPHLPIGTLLRGH